MQAIHSDISLSNIYIYIYIFFFFGCVYRQRKQKQKWTKWDYTKLKNFAQKNCQQNEKATYAMGEDICKWYIPYISDIYKVILLNFKKVQIPFKKMGRNVNEHFPKTCRYPTNTWEGGSISLTTREMQVKTTVRY